MSFLTRWGKTPQNKLVDPFQRWHDDLDHFFGNTLTDVDFPKSRMAAIQKSWSPCIDISETASEFKVKVEVPGMNEEDLDVTFQDNTLVIRGEKKQEETEEKENFHRMESSYGSFIRTIPFGSHIDEDKISANFNNGVLNLKLAKSEDSINRQRKIKIN